MDVLIFFMLFSLISLKTKVINADCHAAKCGHGSPDVRFPFRVQSLQASNCSHPGFELFCNENQTIIHFPSYGYLAVKSISYDIKKLDLIDPKSCVHEVFLNLNLSLTPFQYYYIVKNYTYLNCSEFLSPDFTQVPCLSGSDYHVYVVESFEDMPVSCKVVKTIAIPFAYSPYLADNSFGLGLTWDLTGCENSEAKGGWSRFQSKSGLSRCFNVVNAKVLNITIFIFIVATLITVKTYYSKKLDRQNKKKIHQEIEKLLGVGDGETKPIQISSA